MHMEALEQYFPTLLRFLYSSGLWDFNPVMCSGNVYYDEKGSYNFKVKMRNRKAFSLE